MKKSIFRLFLGFFPKNQPNEIFFEKSGSVTFEPLWTPDSMHNIKKIVRANSEKSCKPTYLPTDLLTDLLTDQANFIGPFRFVGDQKASPGDRYGSVFRTLLLSV